VVTVDGSDPLEVTAMWALKGDGAVLLDVRCGWTGLAISAALRGYALRGRRGGIVGAVDGREGRLTDATEVFLVWTVLDELARCMIRPTSGNVAELERAQENLEKEVVPEDYLEVLRALPDGHPKTMIGMPQRTRGFGGPRLLELLVGRLRELHNVDGRMRGRASPGCAFVFE